MSAVFVSHQIWLNWSPRWGWIGKIVGEATLGCRADLTDQLYELLKQAVLDQQSQPMFDELAWFLVFKTKQNRLDDKLAKTRRENKQAIQPIQQHGLIAPAILVGLPPPMVMPPLGVKGVPFQHLQFKKFTDDDFLCAADHIEAVLAEQEQLALFGIRPIQQQHGLIAPATLVGPPPPPMVMMPPLGVNAVPFQQPQFKKFTDDDFLCAADDIEAALAEQEQLASP
eukprot:TRINITY_DN68027_c10_g1_i1.p1 TRINITY_DN68027_c10_g1~~TRINITY_DN68027_c10_g1_i1.p1  ORF type:complete len:226 (+),score=44.72 TRINITY_DN68027_c10_g1_i1:96-773(+)